MRRLLVPVLVGVATLLLTALPAHAAERSGSDPAGDVPFRRGDITSWRAIHGLARVDLRVRTLRGGDPVATWPNTITRVRWRISTEAAPGPEYFAELFLAQGADTVFVGRVVRLQDAMVTCTAQQFVAGNNEVFNDGNLYRFRFLRGCIGAPVSFRARATFIWDPGMPGGGVNTDFAPNAGPTAPIVSG
jgi:hypothetical protein